MGIILVAEDDADDRLLLRRCLERQHPDVSLKFVCDGEELLAYLHRKPPYSEESDAPWPHLVLLDLNMPRMDGRTALRAIRRHPATRRLPVVILSTSSSESDVYTSYCEGANAFITKQDTLARQRKAYDRMIRFWFGACRLCPLPASEVVD